MADQGLGCSSPICGSRGAAAGARPTGLCSFFVVFSQFGARRLARTHCNAAIYLAQGWSKFDLCTVRYFELHEADSCGPWDGPRFAEVETSTGRFESPGVPDLQSETEFPTSGESFCHGAREDVLVDRPGRGGSRPINPTLAIFNHPGVTTPDRGEFRPLFSGVCFLLLA